MEGTLTNSGIKVHTPLFQLSRCSRATVTLTTNWCPQRLSMPVALRNCSYLFIVLQCSIWNLGGTLYEQTLGWLRKTWKLGLEHCAVYAHLRDSVSSPGKAMHGVGEDSSVLMCALSILHIRHSYSDTLHWHWFNPTLGPRHKVPVYLYGTGVFLCEGKFRWFSPSLGNGDWGRFSQWRLVGRTR